MTASCPDANDASNRNVPDISWLCNFDDDDDDDDDDLISLQPFLSSSNIPRHEVSLPSLLIVIGVVCNPISIDGTPSNIDDVNLHNDDDNNYYDNNNNNDDDNNNDNN